LTSWIKVLLFKLTTMMEEKLDFLLELYYPT
jgi:hypothetical protein